MSATITTDLLEPGNDPSLGHRLLVACAELDGYGAIIDRRPRP